MSAPQNDTIPNGEEIVERFGGIRPMAAKLDVAVTTVQGWKKRDAIPLNRKDDILAAAAEHGVNLKGLISGASANQNTTQAAKPVVSTIAEDPALSRAPDVAPVAAPAPKAAAPKPSVKMDESEFVDLASVRSTARRTSFLTTLGILVLVGGAGYALFGNLMPMSSGVVSVDNSALEARVEGVEKQMGMLEHLRAQVGDMGDAFGVNVDDFRTMAQGVRSGNVQPVLNRLATLEQYFGQAGGAEGLQNVIRRMETTIGQSQEGSADWSATIAQLQSVVNGLQGDVGQLNSALADVQTENTELSQNLQGVSGRDLGAAAMLLALTQVRYMVDREAPFENDLALLRQVAGDDAELNASISKLAPYAENGVLSSEGLKRELQGLSNDIINAKLQGEDVSFKDRAMGRINNLFSLKKDGTPVTGGTERDLIAKATAQLDANDVAGAMATLQQLQGAPAQAATPWTQQASATLAVQALDRDLVTKLVSKINQARSGANTPINLRPQRRVVQPQAIQPEVTQPQAPTYAPSITVYE